MAKGPVTSNVKETTKKWPQPKPARSGTEYNKATKVPNVKTAVVGNFD